MLAAISFEIVSLGTYTATRLFHASKALWKTFSLMLSSTACDSFRMSLFQNVANLVSFSIWETKRNRRGLSPASREEGEQ
jgi:hypothetical protein